MASVAVGVDEEGVSKRRLISAFRKALSPEKVEDIRVTHEDAGLVLGFIFTRCPIEKRVHLEDFEAHIDSKDDQLLEYAVVGGRRVRAPRGAHRPSKDRRPHREAPGRPKEEPTSSE